MNVAWIFICFFLKKKIFDLTVCWLFRMSFLFLSSTLLFGVIFCFEHQVTCNFSGNDCNIYVDDGAFGCHLADEKHSTSGCSIAAGSRYSCDPASDLGCTSTEEACTFDNGVLWVCPLFAFTHGFF